MRTGRPVHPRGFTLIELLVVISIIGLLISILLPSLGKARTAARQLKDAVNLRSIQQGMVIWAQTHDDTYPIPSQLDRGNATIDPMGQPATVKDNSGNIFSILIFNGYFGPELTVSSAEVNPRIVRDTKYEYKFPSTAVNQDTALWDPGFAGYPGESGTTGIGNGRRLGGAVGNLSFAHTAPFGQHAITWKSTYDSRQATLANRGPSYDGSPGLWRLRAGVSGEDSNRLKIFGGKNSWGGNVAFNDTHVQYFNTPDSDQLPMTYRFTINGSRTWGDNVFVNEDESTGQPLGEQFAEPGSNAYLTIYGDVFNAGGQNLINPFVD